MVKSELEYVHKQRKENVLIIDLNSCLNAKNRLNDITKKLIDNTLFKIRRLSHIYVSFSHVDEDMVSLIIAFLEKYNFNIINSKSTYCGPSLTNDKKNMINDSPYILLCISEKSCNSWTIFNEIKFVSNQDKTLVLVFLFDGNDTKFDLKSKLNSSIISALVSTYENFLFFDTSKIDICLNKLISYLYKMLK